MSMCLVWLLGATALLGTVTPGMAQTASTRGEVVSICADVAESEREERFALRGQCIVATTQYLDVVRVSEDTAAERDQAISDLVADLTQLLFTPDCVELSEVAQAIAMASADIEDPDQRAQVLLIYQMIDNCEFGVTAAVVTPLPNTFPPPSIIDGPSASES
jgi:hypothetical protein